jgi:ankyrin repeat domain-containing protein 50
MGAVFSYARKGDLEGLKRYSDFNVTDGDQWTPLAHAVFEGHDISVKYMLDHGADPNLLVNYEPIICCAIRTNQHKCLKLLLDYGVNPNLNVCDEGPLLYMMLNHGDHESLQILLLYKPTIVRDEYRTVFHDLFNSNKLQCLLEYAQATNQLQDIDYPDEMGNTPLMRAVYRGYYDLVQLLLNYGADPDLKDNYGRTARTMAEYIAEKNGDRYICDLIISYDIPTKGAEE